MSHLQTPIWRIKQQIMHGGEENGDCLRAAVASLMKLPLGEVPHFCSRENEAKGWVELMQEWFAARGYAVCELQYGDWVHSVLPGAYYLLSGRSPRFPDEYHVVIAQEGQVVHDPHPDDSGVLEPTNDMPWLVMLFIPLVPASLVSRQEVA